ncbi:hypothetical protein JTE90_010881 [Oedothorax gibbosus]|uniref:Uncharacterized protein n=1 Tax=Oedothorax gibbosus TaxID=931172 RepID=A0AAV6U386_9ARAC|nr:hypothetical protein JTE90_010881 [Oedothorax gibbosus]
MSYNCLIILVLLHNIICFHEAGSNLLPSNENFDSRSSRKLLAVGKHTNPLNRAHNNTKGAKVTTPYPAEQDSSAVGTEAAVLFIVVVVVLSVIGMVIYFIRKFDQLNRSLPTYRYSSLKTEINGYGHDDKNESQHLVNVSTEEEDDDEEESEEVDISPPTLLVRSQTVMPAKPLNGHLPVIHDGKMATSNSMTKSVDSSVDSDDELLQ